MRSKEITLGRTTPTHQVDVDFSLEGPAWKVSIFYVMIYFTLYFYFMMSKVVGFRRMRVFSFHFK